MGVHTINKVQLIRKYKPREIIVCWHCEQLGYNIKKFTWEQLEEATKFASAKFSELSM